MPCSVPTDCGGYVCTPRYQDASSCVEDRQALHEGALDRFWLHEQDPTQGCEFPATLADECLRQNEIRACSAIAPAACALALRDCNS